jgi:hypothetical protein
MRARGDLFYLDNQARTITLPGQRVTFDPPGYFEPEDEGRGAVQLSMALAKRQQATSLPEKELAGKEKEKKDTFARRLDKIKRASRTTRTKS